MKLKKFDRIEIHWLDSVHQSGWTKLKTFEELEKQDGHGLRHSTIGYLVLEDKEVVIVCQSKNCEPKFTMTVDALMSIPKKCIVSIKKI